MYLLVRLVLYARQYSTLTGVESAIHQRCKNGMEGLGRVDELQIPDPKLLPRFASLQQTAVSCIVASPLWALVTIVCSLSRALATISALNSTKHIDFGVQFRCDKEWPSTRGQWPCSTAGPMQSCSPAVRRFFLTLRSGRGNSPQFEGLYRRRSQF